MSKLDRVLTLLQNALNLILIPFWDFTGIIILLGYFMPDRILTAVFCFLLALDTWIIYELTNEKKHD